MEVYGLQRKLSGKPSVPAQLAAGALPKINPVSPSECAGRLMDDLSQRTCCVYDNGLFPELARTLAQSFGRVLYYSSWESGFPRSNATIVGTGIPGITRINSIWPVLDDIDIFVFPDIFHGDKQEILKKRFGKRVWGSGIGESLEVERIKSKKWLAQCGLPVGPYTVCRGLDALRRELKAHDDRYVKVSRTRGDMETFHSKTYSLIEPRLDELEHTLGAKKAITEFLVEEPIEADIEVGFDGYTIDGKYPRESLFGVETKDAAFLGEVVPYSALPAPLTMVNRKLAPLFRDLEYRGFFSSEIRVAKDGRPFLIDPCCRMASPPGELYCWMIDNLAEIIWHGSVGESVPPSWKYRYGAQLVLKSEWAEHGWQPIEFPDEVAEHVKLHYLTMIQGRPYYVPQAVTMPEVGAIVAGGDSPRAATLAVQKISEQVRGYDLVFRLDALEDAAAKMADLKAAA